VDLGFDERRRCWMKMMRNAHVVMKEGSLSYHVRFLRIDNLTLDGDLPPLYIDEIKIELQ